MKKKFVFSIKIIFLGFIFVSNIFGMQKDLDPLMVYNHLKSIDVNIQDCSKEAVIDAFWNKCKPSKEIYDLIVSNDNTPLIVDIVKRIDLIHKNTEQRLLKNIGIGKDKYVFRTEANEALILFKKRSNLEKSFNDEIELLHKLDHPNILKARNIDFKLFFYVQDLALCDFYEFIDKFNFKFIDQKRTIFEISREDKLLILDLLENIAEALNYLASQNIVHRDIKLENILIYDNEDTTFTAKLSDLSFAIKIPESETFVKQRSLKGTPFYLNPKSIYFIRKAKRKFGSEGKYYMCSYKDDLYAFGVMLYLIFHRDYPINYFIFIYNSLIKSGALSKNIKFTHFYAEYFVRGKRASFFNSLIEPEINDLILDCWNMDVDFCYIILKIKEIKCMLNDKVGLSDWTDDEVEYPIPRLIFAMD